MKPFAMGLFFGLTLTACAGWQFKEHYRWYGLDAESYKGSLRGPAPKDDLDLTVCQPDNAEKGKCGCFLNDELERMVLDMEKTKADLKACQEGGHTPAQ